MRKYLWMLVCLLIFTACGNMDEDKANNENDHQSVAFRHIDVVVEEDQVQITGEMNSWDGNFYYHVLQGEEKVIEEQKVSTDHIDFWSSFTIDVSKDEINESEEIPHLVLYGKDEQEKQINPNYIPIDLEQE